MSLLLDSSASMEQHLGTLQTAATNFIKKLKSNDLAQVIDFDSRVEIRQGFTGNQGELEAAIQQTNAGGSIAAQRDLHRAQGTSKVKAVSEEDVRRQALIVFSDGEDTSSLGLVRGSARSGKALRNSDLCHRAARQRRPGQGFREAEFVMRTLAQETGGRAFFPAASRIWRRLCTDRRRARQPVPSATRRGISVVTARGAGSWSRSREPTSRRAPRRATTPRRAVESFPLVLYTAAAVVYAIHFAKRQPSVGRMRRRPCCCSPRFRTPSS